MSSKKIPVAGPWITQKEIDYVNDAVKNAWYCDANIYHLKFEKAFAHYVGMKYSVALPSCTSAIHLALMAAGIGPGDEVIVPDATWIASVAPVTYVGATPIFGDMDAKTWCLSADSFQSLITSKTKAVIPVDLYGSLADYEKIRAVAARHNILVIEDAAESIGSEYFGKKAGSLGEIGVFSFHGSKTLTTGEGGMLVTDRKDLFDRVLTLRDHGRPPQDRMFFNTEVAHKYKMSSMQCALGLAQLERIDELIEKKRQIFSWYKEYLGRLPGIELNSEPAGIKNSFWMITAILDPKLGLEKRDLMARLSEHEIDSRPFFHPLSSLPAFEKYSDVERARSQNKVTYSICPYGINLPSALCLTREDVERVCSAFQLIIAEAARAA